MDWIGKVILEVLSELVRSSQAISAMSMLIFFEWTAAIGRLRFSPDELQDNVHTLLASVSDIALGGPGHVNGVPARTKRREAQNPSASLSPSTDVVGFSSQRRSHEF